MSGVEVEEGAPFREVAERLAAGPKVRGGVVAYGSSILEQWPLEEATGLIPMVNRSFGGACTGDLARYFDRLVAPCEPRLLVFYGGSNDLAAGRAGREAAEGFFVVREKAWRLKPEPVIVYLSVIRSPSKREIFDRVDEANGLVRAEADGNRLVFFDLNEVLAGAGPDPAENWFVEDGNHLTREAYRTLSAALAPVIRGLAARMELAGSKMEPGRG